MYGLTECKRVSYLPPEQLSIRPQSVGRGMPNEEVYIVDERGQRVGQNVAEDDPCIRSPQCASRLDELLFSKHQKLGAH